MRAGLNFDRFNNKLNFPASRDEFPHQKTSKRTPLK